VTIVWHPLARADLLDIVAHVAAEDPAAALRLHQVIGA
jgi:plasmid stabilization system protein ParE